MKQGLQKVLLCFGAGILVQGGAYFYLDQVLFAPASDYNVSDINKSDQTAKADKEAFAGVKLQGKPYYSHDYRYMADVSDTSVTIYDAKNLGSPQVADLKGQGVSFFEWLPDRNLALMALYPAHWKGGRWNVTLARYNPDSPNHESDAPVDDLPKNSKIVGVAYSTATNAVYMKMQGGQGLYRIYRTDANYDTRRIYVQTSDIGKIAVFYDEDRLFYDDADRGVMYTFNGGDSSWRVISPPGMFRLVDVDREKNIYAARINRKGEAIEFYVGKLGVGFNKVASLDTPMDFNLVTVHTIQEMEKSQGTGTTK